MSDFFNKTTINHLLAYSGSIAVAVLALVLFLDTRERSDQATAASPECTAGAECTADADEVKVDPFESVYLQAKSAVVWDVARREVLFERDASVQLPLASLTKVMTALIAGQTLPEGLIITIEAPYLEPESDDGLLANERWRLSDLLDFTLIKSSNDGALALAAVAGGLGQQDGHEHGSNVYRDSVVRFTEAMNTKARELGLTQTYFINGSGLDISDSTAGSYGSAGDMARLFEHALGAIPDTLGATRVQRATFTSASGFIHTADNTNALVNRVPGLIAGKTGYTDLAGGNLVIAFDAGPAHPVIVVVLGSTLEGRFSDAEQLVWAALEKLSQEL